MQKRSNKNFLNLLKIMEKLRSPHGCPWDRAQTHKSLLPYLIEEAYEVLDSLEAKDYQKFKEELGDLLLQIIFHSQIASERKKFDINDVILVLTQKLRQRHPHVFKKKKKLTPQEVINNWEHIKIKTENRSVLSGLPKDLPALLKAYRVGEKVARFGFDWHKTADIFEKIEEELNELKGVFHSRKDKKKKLTEQEMGDVLFCLVNLSRHLKINPESALRQTIQKFVKRFNYIEKQLSQKGKSLHKATLKEMDLLWEEAKKKI
jgi:tetrapyrrole methylase family protein/MazG family protein